MTTFFQSLKAFLSQVFLKSHWPDNGYSKLFIFIERRNFQWRSFFPSIFVGCSKAFAAFKKFHVLDIIKLFVLIQRWPLRYHVLHKNTKTSCNARFRFNLLIWTTIDWNFLALVKMRNWASDSKDDAAWETWLCIRAKRYKIIRTGGKENWK